MKGPPIQSLDEKLSWVERFIKLSSAEDINSTHRKSSSSEIPLSSSFNENDYFKVRASVRGFSVESEVLRLPCYTLQMRGPDSEVGELLNEDDVRGVLHLNCS